MKNILSALVLALGVSGGVLPAAKPEKPPLVFVSAGTDKKVPQTEAVMLTGYAAAVEQKISSQVWTKVSGSDAVLTSPKEPVTLVTGLKPGAYVFRLTATTDQGLTAQDEVALQILPPIESRKIDMPVSPNGEIYRPDLTSLGLEPGDTLVIPPGDYPDGITLGTFAGTAEKPITIVNGPGGPVKATHLRINNATFFKLSGSGSADAYGFQLGRKGVNAALAIGRGTGDVEVERVEISKSDAGMMCKLNPTADDPLSQYPNFIIKNVRLHDLSIHDVNGEGMYIGHTGPDGGQVGNPLVPIRLDHVKIYDNRLENTGWDGIQLSNARDNAEIHHNLVKNYGTVNMGSQQAGIILGGNTCGRVHHNVILGGTGNGLQFFGYGEGEISDNFLDHAGAGSSDQDAIYANDIPNKWEKNPPLRLIIIRNVINQTVRTAIRNANYHSSEQAGRIAENVVFDARNQPAKQLIVSGALDEIVDNVIIPQ
jgi:hypothetical protein